MKALEAELNEWKTAFTGLLGEQPITLTPGLLWNAINHLRAEKEDLVLVLKMLDDDFKYLEGSCPGLYLTGAGYVLAPRVLEIRKLLGSPTERNHEP